MDEAERETQAAGEPSHARRAMCDESRPTPPQVIGDVSRSASPSLSSTHGGTVRRYVCAQCTVQTRDCTSRAECGRGRG